ncbi:MAG: hypothetical protein ACHQ49_07775, partial [Elusimicrobiota bacterium]
MKRIGRGGVFFIGAIAFYAVAIGAWAWRAERARGVRLSSDRPEYLHYDIVELRLRATDAALADEFEKSHPSLVVTRPDGLVVTTVAGIREVELTRAASGLWTGRWPVPWNAPEGEYIPALLNGEKLKERLKVSPFRVGRRKPFPLPPGGFIVATLETVAPLATLRVKAPDGTEKDWRGLLDWAQSLGANALMVLGGQSPGLKDGQVWVDTNLKLLPEVAKECRARG